MTEKVGDEAVETPITVEEARALAAAGDAYGMERLGTFYEKGEGVPQDHGEALKWFEKAADAGDKWAAISAAHYYREGLVTPKNPAKAIELYKRSDGEGDGFGYYFIAEMYAFGDGVPVDAKAAAKWFDMAVKHGSTQDRPIVKAAPSPTEAGNDEDIAAAKWFREKAEKGEADGQFWLGTAYELGKGVPKNLTEAAKWYRKAAEQGHGKAASCLAALSAPTGPSAPVDRGHGEAAGIEFPGFIVNASDFVKIDGQLHRVNSDGRRINLKRWWFDKNTGEFYLRIKNHGEFVEYEKFDYMKRLELYYNGRYNDLRDEEQLYRNGWNLKGFLYEVRWLSYFIAFGGMALLNEASDSRYNATTDVIAGLAMVAAAAWFWLWTRRGKKFKEFDRLTAYVGPEPLQRKTDDYGAAKAETPAAHSAQDDLAYKPNN